MKKTVLGVLILLLLSCQAFPQAAAKPAEGLQSRIQTYLDEWHKAGKFPGATFGVCMSDGKRFSLATGNSDVENKVPMQPSDVMLAGSVGKTFAAATALQLVKEGKIGLDDRVEKYLGSEPWFPRLPNARAITVRQLMNHTSGLVRYEFKEQFIKDLNASPDKVWLPQELVSYLLDEKPAFEAGKGWDYSDTNYILLGMIIEKVTGKKFYDLANRRFIKPLKLNRTSPQDRRELKNLIQGYAGEKNEFVGRDRVIENGRFIINPQFEWTGGGFVSNSEDLARWAVAMYEGKAIPQELKPQMLDGVATPNLGPNAKYGLGVTIRPTRAGLTYGHSGFFPGYLTEMMYFPADKMAISIQVNTSVPRNLGRGLGRVVIDIAEIIKGAAK